MPQADAIFIIKEAEVNLTSIPGGRIIAKGEGNVGGLPRYPAFELVLAVSRNVQESSLALGSAVTARIRLSSTCWLFASNGRIVTCF